MPRTLEVLKVVVTRDGNKSVIHLKTLGALRCTFDGTPTDLPRQRVRCALLILLASERRVSRARARALLWPESDSKAARHVLSQTLYELRRSFGDDWFTIDDDTICATHRLSIDTESFENVARAGAHRLAMQFYAGPFLAGFVMRSRPWNVWVEERRRSLEALHRELEANLASRRQPVRAQQLAGRPLAPAARRNETSPVYRRGETQRPRLRAAMAAAVAFITLFLHAVTPGLMPAAITIPDASRYAVFAFDSDLPPDPNLDEQNRVMRALGKAGLTGAIVDAGDIIGRTKDLAARQRAARAVAAGRIITGRVSRIDASVIVTADATESFGAERQIGHATIVLRPGADADSAFVVLVELLRTDAAR